MVRRFRARRDERRHDVHGLSGAYAADAVDDADRAAFEAHLVGCATCRSEVAALRLTAAELTRLVETAPPPGLRTRVLAAVSRVRRLRIARLRALGSRSGPERRGGGAPIRRPPADEPPA